MNKMVELKVFLEKIRLVIFDVDGVLTDGRLYYGADGECMKVFNVKDGMGMYRLMQQGCHIAIITGRESPFVARRAADWGILHVYQGIKEKLPVFETLLKEFHLNSQQSAYMGDDLIDIPVMEQVGCAACPADAVPCVQKMCHFISQHKGGCGAAREFCDAIYEAQHLCDI